MAFYNILVIYCRWIVGFRSGLWPALKRGENKSSENKENLKLPTKSQALVWLENYSG